MAKTAAERQADYRAKKLAEKSEHGHQMAHLTLIISAAHRSLLTRVALLHGVTQAEMISMMIESSPLVRDMEKDRDDFLSGNCSRSI